MKPLSYAQVRLAGCRVALVDLLRRWVAYVVVGVLILGCAGSHALSAMAGLASWSVAPLFQSAQQPWWIAAAATLVHAGLGCVAIWGLRPMLWSPTWRDSENALPIPAAMRRRADGLVVLFALLPLYGVYAAGSAVWLVRAPDWLVAVRGEALTMLGASLLLSLCGGMFVLHRTRLAHDGPAVLRESGRTDRVIRPQDAYARVPAAKALVLLPLLHGPARRSGKLMMGSTAAMLACIPAMWWWPAGGAWWLAAFATLAVGLTTRLHVVVKVDFAELHEACTPLPIAARSLLWARRALSMLPLGVALTVLVVAMLAGVRGDLNPLVLASYATWAWFGCAMLVVTAGPGWYMSSSIRVSLWLLVLVVLLALASEVLK